MNTVSTPADLQGALNRFSSPGPFPDKTSEPANMPEALKRFSDSQELGAVAVDHERTGKRWSMGRKLGATALTIVTLAGAGAVVGNSIDRDLDNREAIIGNTPQLVEEQKQAIELNAEIQAARDAGQNPEVVIQDPSQ